MLRRRLYRLTDDEIAALIDAGTDSWRRALQLSNRTTGKRRDELIIRAKILCSAVDSLRNQQLVTLISDSGE